MEKIDLVRKEVRNAQLHGDFYKLTINYGGKFKIDIWKTVFSQNRLSKLMNTPSEILNKKEKKEKSQIEAILKKPLTVWTSKEIEMFRNASMSFAQLIPGKKLFEVQSEQGAMCISLINIFIVEFFILQKSTV